MFSIKANPNNKKIYEITSTMPKTLKNARRKAFYHIGKDLVKESKRLIDLPKTGKLYKVFKRGKVRDHRASAPGEAPAKITGDLRASISYSVRGSSEMEFGSRRSTKRRYTATGAGFKVRGTRIRTISYPKLLEEGTSKMAARPFLKPAIESNYRNIVKRFTIEFEKELEKRESRMAMKAELRALK